MTTRSSALLESGTTEDGAKTFFDELAGDGASMGDDPGARVGAGELEPPVVLPAPLPPSLAGVGAGEVEPPVVLPVPVPPLDGASDSHVGVFHTPLVQVATPEAA